MQDHKTYPMTFVTYHFNSVSYVPRCAKKDTFGNFMVVVQLIFSLTRVKISCITTTNFQKVSKKVIQVLLSSSIFSWSCLTCPIRSSTTLSTSAKHASFKSIARLILCQFLFEISTNECMSLKTLI